MSGFFGNCTRELKEVRFFVPHSYNELAVGTYPECADLANTYLDASLECHRTFSEHDVFNVTACTLSYALPTGVRN